MASPQNTYTIVETDRLATALAHAALIWPEARGDNRILLEKIITVGIEGVLQARDAAIGARFEALNQAAGSMTGVWPDAWRRGAREEWPQ
jgi:hypothetical protein